MFDFAGFSVVTMPRGNRIMKWLPILIVFLVLAPAGCSKDEVKKMATNIKQKSMDVGDAVQGYTQQAADTLKEQLPETGSVALRMNPPIEVDSAKVEVVTVGDGRDNIVQISTYDIGTEPTKYPVMLVHGHTDASGPAMLVGKNIPCDLYIQETASSPVIMTPPGKSVDVNFLSIDAEKQTLKVSISSVALIASDDNVVSLNGGNVTALISGGN